jgi:NACalpha-BTF3-like transcription factor
MKLNFKKNKVTYALISVVVMIIIGYSVHRVKEHYDSPGPSVGPTPQENEIDEEVDKKVKEKEISQEDLDLVFEMLNST